MSTDVKKRIALEIAHVLFIDIVGSKSSLTRSQKKHHRQRVLPRFDVDDTAPGPSGWL